MHNGDRKPLKNNPLSQAGHGPGGGEGNNGCKGIPKYKAALALYEEKNHVSDLPFDSGLLGIFRQDNDMQGWKGSMDI